jgi:hypothetical protein
LVTLLEASERGFERAAQAMSIKPLWPLVLLVLLYWQAPWIVPHAVKLARGGIIFTAILLLPALIYASLHGSPSRSIHVSTSIKVLADLGYAGMFVGFTTGVVCFLVDVKRGH